MEYPEMLDRLKHIRDGLEGEMRKLTGYLKDEAECDLTAFDWAITIVKEQQYPLRLN